ncbi:MAG: TolC family protein [Solidesulfovibrio sp.]
MVRDLAYRQGVAASGGGVCVRAAALAPRMTAIAALCAVLLLGVLPVQAGTGDRYTKDKPKNSATSTAPAQVAKPVEQATSSDADSASDYARSPVGSSVALGPTAVKSPADFQECVRVTLAQSPLLTKSSIEIESKRLDVGDAYSQYIPTMVMSTTFYLRLPEFKNTGISAAQTATNSQDAFNALYAGDANNRNRKKYDLSFSTGAWNPILTAFEVAAKKEMVNIAVLSHLKVIDGGLKQLGKVYLQLGMIESMLKVIKEKEELAVKNLEYAKTKVGLGQGAQLDIRIAESKINVVKAEAEKLRTNKAVITDQLKFLMGIPFVQKVDFVLDNASQQVLEDFNPANVTDEKLRKHSFALRIHEYEKALQKKNIALSYVHFLPTFSVGFTSVSTLSDSSYKDEGSFPFLYPNVTLNMPFDWWTKGRDVSRQYKKQAQLNVEGRNKEFNTTNEFQQALAKLRAANSEVKYAETEVDLQKLMTQQAQFKFESGQVEYDAIVSAMSDYLDAKKELQTKRYDRDAAMLEVRSQAGDFQDRYINASVMENT